MENILQSFRNEMLDTVENNILSFWLQNMIDEEDGGFYGQMRGNGTLAKASEKGLNTDGSMTHEANLDTGYVDDDRHWWVLAEAV